LIGGVGKALTATIEGMAEITTWVCWGVVGAVWVVGAAVGGRDSRARVERGFGSGALWRIGSILAAGLLYRLTWHELHRVTDHARWIELLGLVLLITSTVFTIWARLILGRLWSASRALLRS
jgi:hypothetical protein